MPALEAGEEFRVPAARLQGGRGRLPPETLRALTRLSPVRATLSLVQTFGLAALAVFVAVRFPHPLVVGAAWIAVAGQQHGLAILTHQSAHYRLYETRWLNDLCGKLCGIPLGVSMVTYRVIHRIHHNELYTPLDPDLALMAGYPRGRAYLLRKLGKDLLGVTSLKNYAYFFGLQARGDTSPGLQAAARRDRQVVVAANACLLVGLALAGGLGWYLLLWVVPLLTLLAALLRLRAVLEHGAVPDPTDTARAARTTLAPAWIRWLVYPHGMNFHVEHHLYPAIPHYRLAAAHRTLEAAGALDGAEVSRSIGDSLRLVFGEARRSAAAAR
ncbi:MAG: fatty acid desaturase family protein [Myxococcales bacterium]